MQKAIASLYDLGPFPNSDTASVPEIQVLEELLAQVQTPITDEEACVLIKLFGSDDCFGLTWTLLHIIETAPSWPNKELLKSLEGEWIDCLRGRININN